MDNNEQVIRANRGLGALLSQIGGGAAGAQGNPPPPVVRKDKVPRPEMTEDRGFDMSSEGFSGWGDLSETKQPEQDKWGEGPATGSKREAPPPKAMEGDNKKPKYDHDEDVYGPRDVTKWADVPEYNEQHDQEFFKEENEKMAKKYGDGIISATYIENQPGKVGYYCKICYAEMNSENTLTLHCSGMKHLKKKNMMEKNKGNTSAEYPGSNNDPDFQDGIKTKRDRGGEAGRGRSGEEGRGRSGRDRDGEARRDRGESGRDREAERGRDREAGRGRGRDREAGRETGWGRGQGDLDRRRPRDYDDYKHDRAPADSRSRYDRAQDDYYKRGSPYVDRRQYDDHYYDRGGYGDKYPNDQHTSERYPHDRYGLPGPTPPAPSIGNLADHTVPPAPPIKPQENMSGGATGTLLSKLAACSVKTGDDATLATNVIVLLMKSLKEFNQKKGSANSVHLLDDIAMKINIMKTLKEKEYQSSNPPSSYQEPPPPPSIKDHFSNREAHPNQSYTYASSRW